jgi:hypothetical protein
VGERRHRKGNLLENKAVSGREKEKSSFRKMKKLHQRKGRGIWTGSDIDFILFYIKYSSIN